MATINGLESISASPVQLKFINELVRDAFSPFRNMIEVMDIESEDYYSIGTVKNLTLHVYRAKPLNHKQHLLRHIRNYVDYEGPTCVHEFNGRFNVRYKLSDNSLITIHCLKTEALFKYGSLGLNLNQKI